LQSYRFDAEFEPAEEFDFKGTQNKSRRNFKELEVLERSTFPTILLTDGNQTQGMIMFIVLMLPIKFFQ
jgi:hypothetical protein